MTTATARRNPLASREHETMTLASGNDNKMLAIARIRRDGQTQPRQGMNEDVVTDYVAALADNVRFPAVDVMFDGVDYWLFDGFHRVESHLRSGRTEIEVRIHHGTLEQAQWRSYAANQSHGLRRSTADKERAIRSALKHSAAQGMSDRQIAKHLGVDHKTIGAHREKMQTGGEIPQVRERTGIDGKTYDTTNIGKRATYQPLALPETAEPTLVRPLSLDETIAAVYRALKHNNPHTSDPNTRLTWLNQHSQMRDYEHSLASGVKMELATFSAAWASVAAEQRKAIDSQKRAEAAAAGANSSVDLLATAIRRAIKPESTPQKKWDFLIRYDVQDIYEALLPTELRGTLSPEIYRQARRIVIDEVKAAIHQEAANELQRLAAPKPSVASQVIDLAEQGMDAEIETVLSGINPVDLQATEKAIHNMMADLGEALTFSITIRDGEFSIYWCAPGVPVRNALGRGETMIEAWSALVSEARESKTK